MQMGEGYSPPAIEKKPDDPKDKEPLTIRIILMCDGTNNNKYNIAEREKFELAEGDESKGHKDFGTLGSSYDNGRTNIATMEPHVESGENIGGYSIVVKVYVEGQGTTEAKADAVLKGIALGVLKTGVHQRARRGINDALDKLNAFLLANKPEKYFIQQVDVDVFGFSRGSATARHAIHLITEFKTTYVDTGYGVETVVTHQPLFDRLRTTYGYREMREDQVKIIFAGLYDTVVSVVGSQLMPKWVANNTRDQKAVAKAKFALHLAAADEHRADFPLHRIKSSLDAGKGAEYYLPGVHSDIGGSYNLANDQLLKAGKEKRNNEIREIKCVGSYSDCQKKQEELLTAGYSEIDLIILPITENWIFSDTYRLYAYRKIQGLEYARTSGEVDRVINRGRISDLKEDMKHLVEDGWYNNKEYEQIKIKTDRVATAARINPLSLVLSPVLGSPVSGTLVVNRRRIYSSYCNLPLKFMVEHARKYAILIKPELDNRISKILGEVKEFADLEAALRTYMGAMGLAGSDPSDWLDIKNALGIYPGIRELRNEHCHMSSRFDCPVIDMGFTPRIVKNRRRRFYYEG